MVLLLIYLGVAIGFSFYCSVAEAVLLSISPSFIATLRDKKPGIAKRLDELKSNIDRPLAAILSLNTIAHTIGAAGVGAQAAAEFKNIPLAVISGTLTLLILVFSEIIPKTIGALYWRKLGPFIAVSVRYLIVLLYPLVWLSEQLTRLLSGGKSHHTLTREELTAMAEIGAQQGVLHASESRLFDSMMRFPSLSVADVMTPRVVVISFDHSRTIEELFAEFAEMPVSRIPVHAGTLDDVSGYVLRVDVLRAHARGESDQPLSSLSRDIQRVHADDALPDVMDGMLRDREHMAIVLDQYGSVVGLVTFEDIVETMLGLEIVDEHDTQVDMQKYARDRWRKRAGELGLNVDGTEEV